MSAWPVEWVLVIYYGPSAHRATYGRLGRSESGNQTYTKDYIQLSRKEEFRSVIKQLFPAMNDGGGSAPLKYIWPTGTAEGALVLRSSDRPHLKWETNVGAPAVWRMSLSPSDLAAETIPGDPSHLDIDAAEDEFARLSERGAGQPYLLAVKLKGYPDALHLRAYLAKPSEDYAWASMELVPQFIRGLAAKTSQGAALQSSVIVSGGVAPSADVESAFLQLLESENPQAVIESLDATTVDGLTAYLREPGYGLFLDPNRNHDAWLQLTPIDEALARRFLDMLEANFPTVLQGDAVAELSEVSLEEVEGFRDQIERESYEVLDRLSTVKTRGSAQKAFAEAVKTNYGFRCALTAIETRDFLVASHIVPWSVDQSIRLDPSNGICLSLLVDKAFEKGYLSINDDFTVSINWDKVGGDGALRDQLGIYNGKPITQPSSCPPKLEYLQRRRDLVSEENKRN